MPDGAVNWCGITGLQVFTLQDGDESSADARHDVTEQPLFDAVDSQPADERQKRKGCILGSFGITSMMETEIQEPLLNRPKLMRGGGR